MMKCRHGPPASKNYDGDKVLGFEIMKGQCDADIVKRWLNEEAIAIVKERKWLDNGARLWYNDAMMIWWDNEIMKRWW